MKKKKKKIKILVILLIILLAIIIYVIWGTNSIVITKIQYSNDKIPSEFKGYKVMQISDLHNKKFGNNMKGLLDKVQECNPDIIVITGDLIVDKADDLKHGLEFIEGLENKIPIYYISGNHEAYTFEYKKIKERLIKANVIILDNEGVMLSKNGQDIRLLGLLDPDFYASEIRTDKMNTTLKNISQNEYFQILLSHRPELMEFYKNHNMDIVLTGHAHGGQIRLPFIGGIIAPNQGWFPKYIDGVYKEDDTTMIVSRGLGNSKVPFRILNRPEVILLELQ